MGQEDFIQHLSQTSRTYLVIDVSEIAYIVDFISQMPKVSA